MEIPEVFKEYILPDERIIENNPNILRRENVTIKEMESANSMLTKEQALEDFDGIKYLLDNCYSGHDYWAMHSVDFNKIYAEIQEQLNNIDTIFNYDFAMIFYNKFVGKIMDNHIVVTNYMPDGARYSASCGGQKYAFFTGITVEKDNDKNVVVKSEYPLVKVGDIITCKNDMLFRTLAPKGKEYYYIGQYSWQYCSWEEIKVINIAVNGLGQQVPVHKCHASQYKPLNEHFKLDHISQIPIVRSGTFTSDDKIPYDCGNMLAKSLKEEPKIIWNLAGNKGGSTKYPFQFISTLNDYADNGTSEAYLKTNLIEPKESGMAYSAYREWKFCDQKPMNKSKGTYNGTIYTLINSFTESSAEHAVGYSKCIKNNILIGENSCGVGAFGEAVPYVLKNSLLEIKIPCKIFRSELQQDSILTPDYWVDSADLEGTVAEWIKQNS